MSVAAVLRGRRPGAVAEIVALSAAIAAPTLAIWAFSGRSDQLLAATFLVMVVAALGFATFTATTGVLSFGHASFMGLAAYGSALLTLPVAAKAGALPDLPGFLASAHLAFGPALIVTVLAVTLLGLVVGIPIARLGGSEAAIATLGLLLITFSIIIGARSLTRGSQALFGVPAAVNVPVALACTIVALATARLFRDSAAGIRARAVREDEPAATAVGIRPARTRLVAWTLSAALTAMAGVLLGHLLTVFSPHQFYFDLTFSVLVMLIIGGFASISGAVLGAVLVTALTEILRRTEQSGFLADLGVGQVFGLTEIGLSIALLWVLYRRHEGLLGHHELVELLPEPTPTPTPAVALPRIEGTGTGLAADNVAKAYGGVRALDGVSLQVAPGEIVGLIGPNGSGKTTLLGCLAGTHAVTSGTVTMDGRDLTTAPAWAMARAGLGRTFQTVRLFARMTARENVLAALVAAPDRPGLAACRDRAGALLAMFGVGELAERDAGTLAYGQQRRVEIARAMALQPRILLLDEPAAGMNEAESDDLLKRLRRLRDEAGIGILLVDHDLRLIMRLCDRIVVLDKGRVIATGDAESIRNDPAVREAYLGRPRRPNEERNA